MNERLTIGQRIQLAFMLLIIAGGLIGSAVYLRWWVTLGMACLIASSLMMGPPRLWLLRPRQLNGKVRVSIAAQVLFFAGLALLLSGWFFR